MGKVAKRLVGAALLAWACSVTAPVCSQTTAMPYTKAFRYDSGGRELGTISAAPVVGGSSNFLATRNSYDTEGRLSKVESGVLSAWQNDGVDPAVWTGFTASKTVLYSYDSYGRKIQEAVAGLDGITAAITHFSYDAYDRQVCLAVRMDSTQWASQTDACLPQTNGAQGPDRITRTTYDNLDRPLVVQRAYGTSVQQNYATYTYNADGEQTSVTDADSNYATMAYDGFDRQVQWTFPSPTTHGLVNAADFESYGYDPSGNRTSLRRRDGTTIAFVYDALNRVIEKDVPASVTGAAAYKVFTGYDNRGLQLYARFGSAAGAGIVSTYDGFGRLASSTSNMDGTNRSNIYQYDANGNLTQLGSDQGYTTQYAYDGLDRETTIMEGAGGTSLAQLTYDQFGRRNGLGLGLGATTSSASYNYDGMSRLASLSHDLAGTSADQSVGFGYNSASQIVSRTSSNDAYASNTALNVSRAYAVNGLNQYTAAGPAAFTYDANGNLKADGSNTYVYDGENRLVSSSGVNNVALAYDPMGRLWQTSVGGAVTARFLYDGDKRIIEEDASGTFLRVYVHARGEDEPLVWYEFVGGLSRRFLHSDQQGSITAIADQSGNAFAIDAYDAWGIPNAGNQGRFGYTGQTWIPELGMWYYKARLYSPTLGRFLQTDPVGYKDQINLYGYVGDDPENGRDPTGLAGCDSNLDPGSCAKAMEAQNQVLGSVVAVRAAITGLLRERHGGKDLSDGARATEAAVKHAFGSSTNSVLRTINQNLGHLQNFLQDPGRAAGGMFDYRAPNARYDRASQDFIGLVNPLYRADTVALNLSSSDPRGEVLRTLAHEPLHVFGIVAGQQGEFYRGQAISLAQLRGGTSYALYHNAENYACLVVGGC